MTERVGAWVATDFPLPRPAVAPLGPYVALSRRYRNSVSGRVVTSLLVQCSDTRDVLGHYPPVFYVRHGWNLRSSERQDWVAEGLEIHGMHYQFTAGRFEQPELTVLGFMALPDGTTCRDMEGVRRYVRGRNKYFGVAQVQLICNGPVSAAERDQLVTLFVRAHRPVLDAIMTGVQDD